MLISDPAAVFRRDHLSALLDAVASGGGRHGVPREVRPGVYELGHFGATGWPRGYGSYPTFRDAVASPYGVCDSVDQVLEHIPEIETCPKRGFIIGLTAVHRAQQPAEGGWRWHKWGPYIGKHEPEHEYLYDEKGIDVVYCYHVYQRQTYLRFDDVEMRDAIALGTAIDVAAADPFSAMRVEGVWVGYSAPKSGKRYCDGVAEQWLRIGRRSYERGADKYVYAPTPDALRKYEPEIELIG